MPYYWSVNMNKLTSLSATVVLLAGCSSERAASNDTGQPELSPGPAVVVEDVIRDGFLKFKKKYGCPVDVKIVTGPIKDDNNYSVRDQVAGGKTTISATAAVGESGLITINQDFQTIYPEIADQVSLPHLAAHESVHACALPPKPLPVPISFRGQSIKAISTQGLGLLTDRPKPSGEGFQSLSVAEEGAAEVIADATVGVNPRSRVTNLGYYGMKQLTLTLMKQGDISVDQLVQYQQNNDLPGFFRKVSNLRTLTDENYIELIDLYNRSEDEGKSAVG